MYTSDTILNAVMKVKLLFFCLVYFVTFSTGTCGGVPLFLVVALVLYLNPIHCKTLWRTVACPYTILHYAFTLNNLSCLSSLNKLFTITYLTCGESSLDRWFKFFTIYSSKILTTVLRENPVHAYTSNCKAYSYVYSSPDIFTVF